MFQYEIIKVEPYWNVNNIYAYGSKIVDGIKVEPYWNVNLSNMLGIISIIKYKSRTILECKYIKFYLLRHII